MTKLEEFDLSKIEKLEGTINVALVSVSTFVERIVDNELRSYNKYYPVFDYENKCLKMSAPLNRVGTHCTLVLPFKNIVDECGYYNDCNPERVFFELGLYVMAEMKERLKTKFETFKENIQKELKGELYYD
jgi:hypothetical protein